MAWFTIDIFLEYKIYHKPTFGGTHRLSKFQRHMQLYNRFQCLESTAENLTDTEDGATVPSTFKAASKDIDRGSGQQKQ
ncbi:hypothetical protein G6F42_013498 [Rhizopus arrhizus]|nr:hypothetical protein G6F42_013498 [Rhizopus arrhizus]